MAVTGQSGYNWTPVDEALVRLVYQNRHIVKLPGLTHDMKNTVWKIIAMSLRVRQIANKSPRELEERWYKLRNECVTGLSFIFKIYEQNRICFILLYLTSNIYAIIDVLFYLFF